MHPRNVIDAQPARLRRLAPNQPLESILNPEDLEALVTVNDAVNYVADRLQVA